MKTFYATLSALIFIFAINPSSLTAQESNDHDWEFVDRFDDTEDVSRDDLVRQTILMPNPLISGTTLQILMPTEMEVNLKEVKVYDAKGSQVSASVSLHNRSIHLATQKLSAGIYIVQLTDAIKKKFVVR